MVRTFCDRCGRVIAGASKLGGATERAAMDLERYGDVRVVKILVERPREHEQLHL